MEERNENMISLTADDGNTYLFEVVGIKEEAENKYAYLYNEENDLGLIIVKVIDNPNSDDAEYEVVEDETLITRLYEDFKKQAPEGFDFQD